MGVPPPKKPPATPLAEVEEEEEDCARGEPPTTPADPERRRAGVRLRATRANTEEVADPKEDREAAAAPEALVVEVGGNWMDSGGWGCCWRSCGAVTSDSAKSPAAPAAAGAEEEEV